MSYSRITASLSEQDPFIVYLNLPKVKEKFLKNIYTYAYLPAKENKLTNFRPCLKDLSEIELFTPIEFLLKNFEKVSSQQAFYNWVHQVSMQALTTLLNQKGQLKEAIVEMMKTVSTHNEANWSLLLTSESVKIQIIRSYIEKFVGDQVYLKLIHNPTIDFPLNQHFQAYLELFFPINNLIINREFINKHARTSFHEPLPPQTVQKEFKKEIKADSPEVMLICPMM